MKSHIVPDVNRSAFACMAYVDTICWSMSDTVSSSCVQRAERKNRISYVQEYVVRFALVDRYLRI